jgi:hypothetical protein
VIDRWLIATAGLAVVLVALSTFVHYEVLRLCHDHLPRLRWIASRARVLLAMGAAFCSHLAQIALFAAAYWALHHAGIGTLLGQLRTSSLTFLYFSAETYTSLGFGDVYPVGDMRLVAGIEALTGLLMISWTASFTYLEMRRDWPVQER